MTFTIIGVFRATIRFFMQRAGIIFGRAKVHYQLKHLRMDELSITLVTGTLLLMKDTICCYTSNHLDITWLEEKLYELASGLIKVHRQVGKEIMKLQSLRASTREELYKRIQIGHEFISAYFDQSITLADVARVACLSPNHFLRSYKQLFGVSPHQYLTERRLQEAKRLLHQTDQPITQICLEVGFQSLSSFSSLFSKRFSMSPSQFRQKR